MKTNKILAVAIILAGSLLLLQAPRAAAQDASQDAAPEQDPPNRVARLNFSDGSVSFQPGGEGDWVEAVPNRPLTTGDNLWADKDSRAELHVGSTAIRMDSETSLTFLDLDDHTIQLKLSQGSLIIKLRHIDDGDTVEVDTPNLAFSLQQAGEYRVDVNADGNETDTTVWRGRGEVTGGGSSYIVVADQRAIFTGTDQLDHQIQQIPKPDDFDNWAFSRDQHEDRSETANYISPEMTGYEDLDDNGHWRYVAGYGPVWAPTVIAAGWAPYRFGHWVWVEPWGWTWVDDMSWGFAPFHYGRWAFVTGGWCWVPGPVVVRPVYAPAFVAFVGGGGFSLSFGGGAGVAWFPLGPGEVYVPPYRVSRAYVTNINITNTRVNVTQITNVYNVYRTNNTNVHITYVNQRVPSAVTAVSRETFVNARPVARNIVRVDEREIAQAPVSHMAPVQPVKQSVLGAGAPARFKPAPAIVNRQVVATRNPTPPKAAFEQRKPTTNVRTETPGPAQPAARGNENEVRPQPEAGRSQGAPLASRPQEAVRPQEPVRSPEPMPQQERQVPRPQNPAAVHPLVRQAPPVQDRPEHQQNEEQKFRLWQEQRSKPAPATVPRPPARPPQPPREDKKK
jgi:hypothetical protein